MKIACLGWGSLIWKTGALPVSGRWQEDGPKVPVEFCRISDGGELATALCLNATPVPALWAWLAVEDLPLACQALKEREAIPEQRTDGVGSLIVTKRPVGMLAEWASARGIDAVIWTNLPAKDAATEGRIPSLEEAVAYLEGLSGETRAHARNYIESVPAQINTPYRREIASALGWES